MTSARPPPSVEFSTLFFFLTLNPSLRFFNFFSLHKINIFLKRIKYKGYIYILDSLIFIKRDYLVVVESSDSYSIKLSGVNIRHYFYHVTLISS